MSFKILFTETAFKDLEEIFDFIALDNLDEAEKFLEKLKETTGKLADFPQAGKDAKEKFPQLKNLRYIVYKNYLIYYTVQADSVIIERFIHGAREKV